MKVGVRKSVIVILASIYLLVPNVVSAQVQTEAQLKEKQEEFLKWKFGMFLHFNMGTFNNRDWATGYEDPLFFNPRKLDCNQWAKEMKAAGMNYAVLTVKHTGGWCLWNSKFTNHDMESFKNYKSGNGDILAEYVKVMRKHGIKVGIYYCSGLQHILVHRISGKMRGADMRISAESRRFVENEQMALKGCLR